MDQLINSLLYHDILMKIEGKKEILNPNNRFTNNIIYNLDIPKTYLWFSYIHTYDEVRMIFSSIIQRKL